ncbi:AraC family transcriptional regulator [Chitinophaga silvatica]|uniref:AraC family transcriptional regulator n=1 Tax=Chitinophaga silvatica TaxID=2282649 RepID=A0A3E1YD35_9BACT|nr:helix-turn-helix transcriptional regulator [Chitinophaga silvatica]RFS24465.1 AraC family transcriptional regulator [Chitinophaga silvatica]
MSFADVFNTLLILGTLQGLILSVLLFFTKKNRRANRFLAVVMLLFALASLNLFIYYSPAVKNVPILFFALNFIPLILVMPIGPLIYFYVRSNFEPDFKLNKNQRWHFAPAIIDIVPQLTAAIFVIGVLTNTIRNNPGPWTIFIDTYNIYADIPRWLSVSLYIWTSIKYLRSVTGVTNNRLKWFRQFLQIFMVFQAIWGIYLIPYVIPAFTDFMLNTFDWYPVYIPMVVLIYTLGLKGYLLPAQEPLIVRKSIPPPESTVNEVVPLLIQAMEQDKKYLDPALDLTQLSKHIGIPAKTISAVLNQHLHQSFNEFINSYRISSFQQRVLSGEFKNMTIMGIAFESGFNSQATFQRSFKQQTGISPSEFIQQNTQKVEN